jgi:hypothetical protein
MSRQAEAERERRARIITADGEYQASKRLAAAAAVMSKDPAALQLRLLQTVVEVAAEKNSTLVMPIPVELLRFFDRVHSGGSGSDTAEEPGDLGDAEVVAAEAAISHTEVPELGAPEVPPVPEVAAASASVPELGTGDGNGAAADGLAGSATGESATGEEVPIPKR